MANQLFIFTTREDELQLLRFLERDVFEVYPRRVPQGWKPFRATAAAIEQLPAEELYLVASDIGPALVDQIKRGPDKGSWRIDEVRSPVVFWERSRMSEEGELLSGQLWAELDVTSQTGRRDPAPERFRRRFLELEAWVRKTYRKGDPKGFWIGPGAARLVKETGVSLRENKHWGRQVVLHGETSNRRTERPRRA